MTPTEALRTLTTLRTTAPRNPRQAHALQDTLYRKALQAIARGETDDPQQLAATVLQAENIPFARNCA